jgi:hypothetical protein
MVAYVVRHRTTTPWKEETVDAGSREQAIHQIVDAAAEGTEVEVSTVTEDFSAPKAAPAAKKEESHGKK